MIKNKEHILQQVNILSVVEDLTDIKLERSGSIYRAVCPFHTEKTPSFFVTPSKGIYKCFGCQEGGDAADLLMKLKGLTFYEALEEIANLGQIELEYSDRKDYKKHKEEERKRKEIAESQRIALESAIKIYEKNSRKSKLFAGREYTDDTAKAFRLIWPCPGNPISEEITKGKILKEPISHLGLVCSVPNSESGLADRFANRFLFPITDPSGRVVGLAGRVKGKGTPKYLNTKNCELFDKSKTLYGFHQARKEINATDTVYIVEGYTDVITCHQYGLKNVVATCGTALTEDHLNLLRRYGVKTVVLFRDGDKAGMAALKKEVMLVVAKGFTCKILLCHDGKDPDDMARELGEKGLRGFRESEQDGIIWRTMLDYDKNDPAKQSASMMVAAELLSFIRNEGTRDIYKKMICRPENLGNISKTLDREIQRFEQKGKPRKKSKIDTEENVQGMQYGIFQKENAYYRWSSDGQHTQITNFIIVPAYLVKDRESSTRIITIKNIYGHSTTISVPTDVFGTMQRFEDEIAKHGNYIFEAAAKGSDFKRIKKLVYDEMNNATAYQVVAMGWHHNGFWVWNNGITDLDGNFIEADENGLVEHKNNKYLLPGYGKIDDDNFDQSDAEDEYITQFRYYKVADASFEEWSKLFIKVYGENGMVGTAFWMATAFRDFIFKKKKGFPLLNSFGKTGKGKSTMMWSLQYLYGRTRLAGPLGTSTYTMFYNSFAQVSNAIVWWDEYSNNLDERFWIMPMMNIWDGKGKSKANIKSRFGGSSTPVRASLAYSGQDLPMGPDMALLNRSIVLVFKHERTPEGEENLKKLRSIEETGKLCQLTAKLITYRPLIEQKFDIVFDDVKNDIEGYLQIKMVDLSKVHSRILMNYAIVCTVFRILEKELPFAFTYVDLCTFCCDLIEMQTNTIASSDSSGMFWNIVEHLLNSGAIMHNREVLVQDASSVKVEKSRIETEEIIFTDKDGNKASRKVMFMRHKEVYMAYAERMRQIGSNPLELSTIEHYLKQSNAFIGAVKAKRFGEKTLRCWAFDLTQLEDVEIPLSIEAGGGETPIF